MGSLLWFAEKICHSRLLLDDQFLDMFDWETDVLVIVLMMNWLKCSR